MSELSPAAQAVLNAFLGDAEYTGLQMDDMRENVAAAIRAAADQVVPEKLESYGIRYELLRIAEELEAQ
jgi:hypothetical protein